MAALAPQPPDGAFFSAATRGSRLVAESRTNGEVAMTHMAPDPEFPEETPLVPDPGPDAPVMVPEPDLDEMVAPAEMVADPELAD
jgi:hypothetical protein